MTCNKIHLAVLALSTAAFLGAHDPSQSFAQDTPATSETPATGEAPAETPASETPASEAPATEAPASEQPAAETPETAAPQPPADPATVVATVGDKEINEGDLALISNDLEEQIGSLPPEQQRAAALSALIDIMVLARKAEGEKLADSAEFKRRVEFLRERALHNAYFSQFVVNEVTDEAVKARYDEQIASLPTEEEMRARHILVKTKEEADAIVAELDGGADFEALAKERSTGPSGPQGGDLGFFSKGQMVPEFEQAAMELEPGTYTKTPVETQFGFHVIKLEEKRAKAPPAFEQVEPQLRQLLMRDRYARVLDEARSSVEVKIEDEALAKMIEEASKPVEAAPAQ